MARRNRRRIDEPRPAGASSARHRDEWQGEWYVVRSVPGQAAAKPYRCPGCDQLIPAGVPHVVVWPEHGDAVDERRHWHRACWAARNRRGPLRPGPAARPRR